MNDQNAGPTSARDEPLRVAVVGAGSMGANHARVYSTLKGVELVAIIDADTERAAAVADRHGGRAGEHLRDLRGEVDAVSVAVPSTLHCAVGVELLSMGIDVLVEKPIASTPAEARLLVEAANDLDRVLLVGHIERFNPAVEQLKEIVQAGPPLLAVDARRMSAVSSRVTDVDVVTDLMIHDLEIVLDLVGDEVVDVVARATTANGRDGTDYVTAMVSFAGGALASFVASRVTQNQIRELQVTTEERLLTVDYPAQELLIHRQGRIGSIGDEELSGGRYVLDVGTERVFVRRSEPLVAELTHFLAAVRGDEAPRVSGRAALRALELATQIREMTFRSRVS